MEKITSLITKGTTPKDKSGEGEINFIKVENIDPSSGEITSCSRISLEEHDGYLKRSQLKENDILFSIAGTLGRTSVVYKGILPANTNQALAILRVSEGDISYLVTVLSGRAVSDFIKKNPTVGAQPNLSLEQVSNLEIPYPSIEEQQKIGDYFRNLDSLITLHQRECFSFDFSGESAKTAQKTISWEQRKVGDVLSESRDAGHSGDIAKKLTVKLWGKGVYAKDDKGSAATQYFTRHAGQFIYSKLDFLNSAFGVVPQELESYESTADLPAFDCVGVEPYFMFYRAIQPSFYLTNGMIADGSRKAKRIHVETFLDMPLDLPSIEEQQKVASYFIQLDSLITLHQHKPNKKGHDVLSVMPFKGNQRKPHYLCT